MTTLKNQHPESWGIVTDAGTLATDGLLLEMETTVSKGTTTFIQTRTSAVPPPPIVDGETVIPVTISGRTVRVALSVTPLYEAEIVTFVVDGPGLVVMENDAEVEPAGIVTDAGTVAEGSLLDNDTVAPPAGAGPVSVNVPVELAPPVAVVGDTENCWTLAG